MVFLTVSSPRKCSHRPFPQPFPAARFSPSPSFGQSNWKGQLCLHGDKIVEYARNMLKSLYQVGKKNVDMYMVVNTTK